jgi:ABC-type thiamin/hydroxymethylpyrimidine transport system permease subunit
MKKTWKPLTAGILSIIAGGVAVILGCGFLISLRVAGFLTTMPKWLDAALTYPAYPLVILGLLAIAGGICALVRRAWGFALAGAIAAFLVSPILGLLAIIFVALAKGEFSK